ncbi:alpha/beta hydrolase [Luteimonas sp. SX5]|uniref:Alpha/beta hydrolase n=1 Tax=Luteimonas galliterrae TaxID=2940486 RepID=A0ABT0MEZ8_9GAMM|nr:alpha/beta fold hydrolase [Luteimonas galliterrae]MCL1633442.1 alpha/beta hydrolase [Luteimonas galliterrae]
MKLVPILASLLLAGMAWPNASAADIERRDFHVTTSDGIRLHVRELAASGAKPDPAPLIMIHGARVSGIGSFDLPVANGSLAADLARRTGRKVYVMDARGYGGSQRPAAMDRPASESRPLSRAYEVVRDIDAVVGAVRGDKREPVALLGWATGGMWAAYYASLRPENVDRLITLNALYGGSFEHAMLGRGSSVSDPEHPERLNPDIGGYAEYPASSLFGVWDRSIPVEDKASWRDPAIAQAYASAALTSDPASKRQDPPVFRAPMGAMEDSFYQATGRRLFDASSITARILIVRSDRDFWSRPEDAETLARDAVRSAGVKRLDLPDATHMVHLDRPEHGRDALLAEIVSFLADAPRTPPR